MCTIEDIDLANYFPVYKETHQNVPRWVSAEIKILQELQILSTCNKENVCIYIVEYGKIMKMNE